MLDAAARSVVKLGEKIEEYVFPPIMLHNVQAKLHTRIKTTDAAKLQNEYARLVEGLQDAGDDPATDEYMSAPGIRPANNLWLSRKTLTECDSSAR